LNTFVWDSFILLHLTYKPYFSVVSPGNQTLLWDADVSLPGC